MKFLPTLVTCLALGWSHLVHARVVYQCMQDNTLSVSTQPEPGSKCVKKEFEDTAQTPNIWAGAGVEKGTVYSRMQDGVLVYGTRNIKGSTPLFDFTIPASVAKKPNVFPSVKAVPRLGVYDQQFAKAAKAHQIDESFLRAVAHAESNYQPQALSPKGAMGVMQLMPDTANLYGVKDPFLPEQSINAGAKHLAYLLKLYSGDKSLAAAAYNAGVGAVKRYKGVPPYAETKAYIIKVGALDQAYQSVLGQKKKHL